MGNKLAAKLAKVMSEVSHIPKNGFNSFHQYKYATESDVSDAVRDKLAAQGVAVIPNVLPETVQIQETTTSRGRTEYILTAVFELTFVDSESGETLTVRTIGQGQDPGDKASYKATTGAYKYAIMKAFLIPTGDDPERDDRPGSQPAKSSGVTKKTSTKKAEPKKSETKKDEKPPVKLNDADLMKECFTVGASKGLDDADIEALMSFVAQQASGTVDREVMEGTLTGLKQRTPAQLKAAAKKARAELVPA